MELKEDWVTPGEEEGEEGMEMRVAETMPLAAGECDVARTDGGKPQMLCEGVLIFAP